MSELNEFEREIEIDGVKVAVDMRTVKKIDVYRVGDNVKVLRKSYKNEVIVGKCVNFALRG